MFQTLQTNIDFPKEKVFALNKSSEGWGRWWGGLSFIYYIKLEKGQVSFRRERKKCVSLVSKDYNSGPMLSEDIHILYPARNFLGLQQEMYWRIKTCLYNDLQFFLCQRLEAITLDCNTVTTSLLTSPGWAENILINNVLVNMQTIMSQDTAMFDKRLCHIVRQLYSHRGHRAPYHVRRHNTEKSGNN